MFGFTFAPRGWLLCNGQLVAITEFSALFSILGTQFGGDGMSTFGMPNFQARIPIGQGSGAGLTPVTVGETRGQNGVTLAGGNLPLHSHPFLAAGAPATSHSPSGAALATPLRSAPPIYAGSAPNTAMGPLSIGNAGSGEPYSNLQPYLVVSYAIATQGIFPSRN
jgi:microcystin-dependent protein